MLIFLVLTTGDSVLSREWWNTDTNEYNRGGRRWGYWNQGRKSAKWCFFEYTNVRRHRSVNSFTRRAIQHQGKLQHIEFHLFCHLLLRGKNKTHKNDLAPNMWLYSSFGKASHWCCEGRGLKLLILSAFFSPIMLKLVGSQWESCWPMLDFHLVTTSWFF